jgi:hypothetical protein
MRLAETTLKLAGVPENCTEVAPIKLLPETVTVVPTTPLVGLRLLIAGEARLKLAALTAVPPGVVTLILPVVASAGTMAVILVSLTTVKLVASAVLNLMEVVPPKSLPVMVTLAPMPAEAGVKLLMRGGICRVVASTRLEYSELPAALMALTR